MFREGVVGQFRGRSSVGRALEWHSRGQGFDSPRLHGRTASGLAAATCIAIPRPNVVSFSLSPVDFSATVPFKPPVTDAGFVIIHKANASGDQATDDSVEVHIKFGPG